MCPVCVQSPIRCPQSPGSAGRVLSAEVGVQNCLTGAALSPQSPWASLAAGAVLCCWVPGKGLQPLQLQGMGTGGWEEGACIRVAPCPPCPRAVRTAQVRGTVLLYLKCFLPHSLPQEGAQPHPPGVARVLPPILSPVVPPPPALPCWGSLSSQLLLATPSTLTSFGSSQCSRL